MSSKRYCFVLLAVVTIASLMLGTPAMARPRHRPRRTVVDCSAGAFHVTHSIKMVNNPVCGPNNGINVDANNITIDLGGHTISAPNVGHFGVFSQSHSRVRVVHGTITGFASAVGIFDGRRNSVSHIHASCPCSSVGFELSSDGLVASSNTAISFDRGMQIGGNGPRVIGNVIRQSAGWGMEVDSVNGSYVGNSVVNSTDDGVFIGVTGSGNRFTGNVLYGNGTVTIGSGIDATNDQTASFKNNIADYNTAYGIDADPGSTDLGGNKAKGNAQFVQCRNIVCL